MLLNSSIRRFGLAAVTLYSLLANHAIPAENHSATDSVNDAKNLARINCGARITWISSAGTRQLESSPYRVDPAADLLLDDSTLSFEMAKGANIFRIALPNISTLDRFAFINERPDVKGTVQVFVSNYRLAPNDTNWVTVGRKVAFGKQRFVNISLAAVEGKYVQIVFDVDKAETIAGIGLYGQRTLAAFANQQHGSEAVAAKIAYTMLQPSSEYNLNFNLANLYARARVVWVSSGSKDLVNRMIDDDPTTGFDFAADDPHPTAIVELAGDQRLRRVSAVYETQRGRLDIYLLNHLRDPSTLDNLNPIVSLTDNAGDGKAAAEFNPRGARYVALRWTPSEHRRSDHKFKIAEIGAFSDAIPAIFDLQAVPEFAKSSAVFNVPKEPPIVVPVSP
jgi:hypothetical protein